MGVAEHKLKPSFELLPISEIARRCRIDRATCSSRLVDLGYVPDESSTAKRQLYPFDSEMELAVKSARDTLSAVRIRGLRANAQIKEMQLAEHLGELVPMHKAISDLHQVIKWIHQEFTERQLKRTEAKLVKAKNVPDVRKILKADTATIMKNLKLNFEKLID